jgi:hypothetical protein
MTVCLRNTKTCMVIDSFVADGALFVCVWSLERRQLQQLTLRSVCIFLLSPFTMVWL